MRQAMLYTALAAIALCACSNQANSNRLAALSSLKDVRANLAFTCTHEGEHLPPLDPSADELFKYARYLEKKEGPKDFNDIGRFYRIAAAYGHYTANINLQSLVSEGLTKSPRPAKETIDLTVQLIAQGVPSGYYEMGHYLELGYGVKQDQEAALGYFRKAADLGSPDGQNYVADLLEPSDKAPGISVQMRKCAAEQGHGEAADALGRFLAYKQRYPEAVQAFQMGVASGNTLSAYFLQNAFSPPQFDRTEPSPSRRLFFADLPNDDERSRRYELIGDFLDNNDGRNPKVPDIDQIVPLPPAKLPEWDGTFQWQKEQDATPPPAKPSGQLIERMSKAKNLDPATGLPLPPPER